MQSISSVEVQVSRRASGLRYALLQVLDTLAYAERELLEAMPAFKHALVLVHLQSDVEVRADPCRLEHEPTVCPQHMLTPHGSDRVDRATVTSSIAVEVSWRHRCRVDRL